MYFDRGPVAFRACPERVPIARYLISAPRACSYSCRLPKQMFFPRGAMDNYCLYCCRQPIVRPYRLHCSARCRDADRRSRHSSEVKDARYKILTVGHDRADEALFAAAEQAMKSADDRALHYRLALDLVDGQPSRSPFSPDIVDKRFRTIIFPEPNRGKHRDTKGLFKPGDFFSLRYPFERPAVPLAAHYRVQFIGLHVLGKLLILTPPFNDGSDVYVELPPSPFVGRWKSNYWGSKELPAYRLRQQARRAVDRARQEKERRDMEAVGGEILDHALAEDT